MGKNIAIFVSGVVSGVVLVFGSVAISIAREQKKYEKARKEATGATDSGVF